MIIVRTKDPGIQKTNLETIKNTIKKNVKTPYNNNREPTINIWIYMYFIYIFTWLHSIPFYKTDKGLHILVLKTEVLFKFFKFILFLLSTFFKKTALFF